MAKVREFGKEQGAEWLRSPQKLLEKVFVSWLTFRNQYTRGEP